MTSIRPISGCWSRRSQINGTLMLYGRLATNTCGRPCSNEVQSTVIASPATTRTPSGTTSCSKMGNTNRSSSRATTDAPVSTRARVSDPRPGPTSTTRSPGPTSASRAIRRTVFGSTTKFCPSARDGAAPCASSSSVACRRVRVMRSQDRRDAQHCSNLQLRHRQGRSPSLQPLRGQPARRRLASSASRGGAPAQDTASRSRL